MKLTTLFIFILSGTFAQAQNVRKEVKAQLKHQRFIEAFNSQYIADSIWFYDRINESYVVKNHDTTFWVLRTPKRLLQHSFESTFDTTIATSFSTEVEVTIDSAVYVWGSGIVNRTVFLDNDTVSFRMIEPRKKKRKYSRTKTVGYKEKIVPYRKLIGFFPEITYMPSDSQMPDLPKNVNPDHVGFILIRCDKQSIVPVLEKMKLL